MHLSISACESLNDLKKKTNSKAIDHIRRLGYLAGPAHDL